MRHFRHLTFTQRLQLEAYLKAKLPKKEIAKLLGVHISTVYREIKRGAYTRLNSNTYEYYTFYSPDISEKKYRYNLSAKGQPLKIGNDLDFSDYIEFKIIKEKYSPEAVLGEIKSHGLNFKTMISKSTLYRYIDSGIFLTVTNKDLPVKRNKFKHKYHRIKPSRAPKGKSIEQRPIYINSRDFFGDWEMDCVEGKKGTKKTLLVFTERKTRYEIIVLMKDKTTASVVKAIDKIERQLGSRKFKNVFRSITVDNGSEFQDFNGIERSVLTKSKRTRVFYCHPYSSYERGSNENQNKLIRRHYPKGFDFTTVSAAEIRKVEKWINNYPRKIFDYYCSSELFEACMNSL